MPSGLRIDRLQLVTNAKSFCIAPILLKGHVIGMCYADGLSEQDIDDESFETFQLFVQQVALVSAAGRSSAPAP